MPNNDKTGPAGAGPKTGRAMGPCGGGTGWSGRRGMGMGCRKFWRLSDQVSDQDRRDMLQEEAKMLKDDLSAIEKELAELKE